MNSATILVTETCDGIEHAVRWRFVREKGKVHKKKATHMSEHDSKSRNSPDQIQMDRSAFGKLEFLSQCASLRLPSPRVDSIEACSNVDFDQACIIEPLAHGLDGLRMIVHRGKHI